MTGFALDWLRLRESADLAARDADLARRFAAALARRLDGPVRLVELGAGSGALFRALAPLIGGAQDWVLVDDDPALATAQPAEIVAWAWRTHRRADLEPGTATVAADHVVWQARSLQLDLAGEFDRLAGLPADALATSALLDLVSAAWLERLTALVAVRRLPLYAALMVDGRRHWSPPLADDGLVHEAFACHQTTDKGFGPALGPAAPDQLAAALKSAGFEIAVAASDWHVPPEAETLLAAVVADEAAAARAVRPDAAERVDAWAAQRFEQAAERRLSLVIGHRDVLGLPRME